jgi:hypothetical protein
MRCMAGFISIIGKLGASISILHGYGKQLSVHITHEARATFGFIAWRGVR